MFHTISLNQHWTTTVTADGSRHERRFGAPRLRQEKVYLCGMLTGPGSVMLNDESLGAMLEHFEIDITRKLKPRNHLVIVAQAVSDVRLVIR